MSVTPSSPVVGVFTDRSMAEQAIGALHNAGFEHGQIQCSIPGNSGSFFEELKSFFTGTGASTGDLASNLTSMGLSDEEARYYSNEYSNGKIILAVQADGREHEVLSILHQYGAYNSQDVFNQATNYTQESTDSTRQDDYETTQTRDNAQNWQTQPPEQLDVAAVEYETDDQASQATVATPEQEIEAQDASPLATGDNAGDWSVQSNVATPDYATEDQAAQPAVVAPDGDLADQASQASVTTPDYHPLDQTAQSDTSAADLDVEPQSPQASAVTSEQTDEYQQLQEQLRATQQQLEEAKAQLQAAKERETQLRTAREREQQLQTAKQQLQDLQSELAATLAELRETQARLTQYE